MADVRVRTSTSQVTPADMDWLSERELRLLEALCDTLVPALNAPPADDPTGFMRRAARELDVAGAIAATLATQDQAARDDLSRLLRLLGSPLGGIALLGRPRGFLEMTAAERERALQAMARSNTGKLRQGFQGLKRLTHFIFYAAPAPGGGDNPNWPALGFTPPPPPPPVPKPITPIAITTDTALDADVVVAGSGAGGGVVAGELARSGLSVLVLEKGGYYNESDFTGREAEMMPRLYLKQGLQSTRDLSIIILAGSCLGGGTVVNWSTSFRTPQDVLAEWERDYGLSGLSTGAMDAHFAAVEHRMGINRDDGSANANNAVIERGSRALGYSWGAMPRNASGCEQRCGACGYGCPYSRKQSTLRTYLQDAAEVGARFVVNCSVDRVNVERGQVRGVTATVMDPATGHRRTLTVRSRAVVVAAGALHTPAVLLRSGIHHRELGRNLWLHPVADVAGTYDEPVRPWIGSIQTRYCDQFAHVEGTYGFTVEAAPAHPGLAGMCLPWTSGREHKELMRQSAHTAALIALVRDRTGGRVTLDQRGEPVVDYRLGDYERRMLVRGQQETARIHLAAGARRVATLHSRLTALDVPEGPDSVSARDLDTFLRAIEERGLAPNTLPLFSAHQMGTARMAGDARRGVVNPEQRVYGIRGLYVADSSVFPTASGVNPMLTILGLAHRAAGAIRAAL